MILWRLHEKIVKQIYTNHKLVVSAEKCWMCYIDTLFWFMIKFRNVRDWVHWFIYRKKGKTPWLSNHLISASFTSSYSEVHNSVLSFFFAETAPALAIPWSCRCFKDPHWYTNCQNKVYAKWNFQRLLGLIDSDKAVLHLYGSDCCESVHQFLTVHTICSLIFLIFVIYTVLNPTFL